MPALDDGNGLLLGGRPSTISLAHLLSASSNETLEVSDLRYFTVVDVAQHPQFAPPGSSTGGSGGGRQELLFFARRSISGQPGALPVLRSLETVMLALSSNTGRLEPLAPAPVVMDHTLSSNLDLELATTNGGGGKHAMLYALGGHHLAWDERKGYSGIAKSSGISRMRPRDGLHLLRASDLAMVASGAWQPWNQSLGPDARPAAAPETPPARVRKASVVLNGRHPGCRESFDARGAGANVA